MLIESCESNKIALPLDAVLRRTVLAKLLITHPIHHHILYSHLAAHPTTPVS